MMTCDCAGQKTMAEVREEDRRTVGNDSVVLGTLGGPSLYTSGI